MNWVCSIKAEKNTLSNMTQEWIWSAFMPLMRRYHKYLLSQDLRRLITMCYTDMLFLKAKSIHGHNCAQIFTDDEVFFGSCLCSVRMKWAWHLEHSRDNQAYQTSFTLIDRMIIWDCIENSNVLPGNSGSNGEINNLADPGRTVLRI